jgi:PEP-CTERM motif
MTLKFAWALVFGLMATAANAETYTYGFEDKIGPTEFSNILGQQSISFDAATFSGGAVLTNATNFPALSNFFPGDHSAYGTSNLGSGLSNTLSIALLPDFHANNVSFTLFNGEINIQDYTVSAFNGDTLLGSMLVNNLAPNITPPPKGNSSNVPPPQGAGSYAFVDLHFIDITNVTITFLNDPTSSKSNPNVWDFLIDDVTFTGTGTFNDVPSAPVPEPETYAMMMAGLGVMGFIARRRKTA